MIPSVPASSSQLKLRQELINNTDEAIKEENGFVIAIDRPDSDNTVPNSACAKEKNIAQIMMIDKLAATQESKLVSQIEIGQAKHPTRVAHSSMQRSYEKECGTRGKRADSG